MCKPLGKREDIEFTFPADSDESALIKQFPKTVERIIEKFLDKRDKQFQSAVKFYKKYKNFPMDFIKDYPEISEKHNLNVWSVHTEGNEWNDWLLDYCLQEIIKQ